MSTRKSTIDDFVVIVYLLQKAAEEGRGLTPLQINKLVYICHGWTLALLDRPLNNNNVNQIQAWKYGPVVQKVYALLKDFGSQEVTYTSFCQKFGSIGIGEDTAREIFSSKLDTLASEDRKLYKVLDMAWYVYKDLSGGQLITMGLPFFKWVKHEKEGKRSV